MKKKLLRNRAQQDINKPEIVIREELTDLKDNKFLINTRIKNVGEYSLESCVEKITETNPGIEIISIEYSPTQE